MTDGEPAEAATETAAADEAAATGAADEAPAAAPSETGHKRARGEDAEEEEDASAAAGAAAKRPATAAASGGGREVLFRVLITSARAGAIIGRGGSVIRQLQEDCRCRIRLLDAIPGVPERLLHVSSEEGAPEEAEWPAEKGCVAVVRRMLLGDAADAADAAAPPAAEGAAAQPCVTRLLIFNSQTGALIGKGGEVARNIRTSTSATLRILPPEELPPFGTFNVDRVVQITSELEPTLAALRMVLRQLRDNPPAAVRGGGGGGGGAMGAAMAPRMPGGGAGPRMPPGGGGAYGSAVGMAPGAPHRQLQPGADGPQSKLLIPVPTSYVGTIIGRGGSNISQIRALSGAKVRVHDPNPGEGTRNVEIQGSPEAVATAQQLVAAYVLSAQSGEGGPPPALPAAVAAAGGGGYAQPMPAAAYGQPQQAQAYGAYGGGGGMVYMQPGMQGGGQGVMFVPMGMHPQPGQAPMQGGMMYMAAAAGSGGGAQPMMYAQQAPMQPMGGMGFPGHAGAVGPGPQGGGPHAAGSYTPYGMGMGGGAPAQYHMPR